MNNIHVFPDSSEVLAIRCRGCSLHRPQLNPVKFTSCQKSFPCIAPYFCTLAVVIPKIKRITDNEYILRSSFFAIQQQALDLHKNKYQQLEFYHNSSFNIQEISPLVEEHDELNDPISYINPISLRKQLARFRDRFIN